MAFGSMPASTEDGPYPVGMFHVKQTGSCDFDAAAAVE
jgi:hypothetical protein